VEELKKESWIVDDGSPRGIFRCANGLDNDGVLDLIMSLGDSSLPNGRDVPHELRLRPLYRDLASLLAPPAALPPSPAASSAVLPQLAPPLCWAVSRPYNPRGGGLYCRSRRSHPEDGSVPLLTGRSGPPLASLPFFS